MTEKEAIHAAHPLRSEMQRRRDEDQAIWEAHPQRSGRHDLYETALRLVGERHEKGDLVDLVVWLLLKAEAKPGGLTHEEIAVACKNVGVDLSCGQCASVFYTGSGDYPHTCSEAEKA